jgi:large subunit ribosomal protein L27
MSKKKAAGKTRQHKRPNPKYLGPKVGDGQVVSEGYVLVRQRGTRMKAGDGVIVGRDHTLVAVASGKVKFGNRLGRKVVSVI